MKFSHLERKFQHLTVDYEIGGRRDLLKGLLALGLTTIACGGAKTAQQIIQTVTPQPSDSGSGPSVVEAQKVSTTPLTPEEISAFAGALLGEVEGLGTEPITGGTGGWEAFKKNRFFSIEVNKPEALFRKTALHPTFNSSVGKEVDCLSRSLRFAGWTPEEIAGAIKIGQTAEGLSYFEMPYFGPSLRELVVATGKPLSPDTLKILEVNVRALALEEGVLLRDIHPGNIILDLKRSTTTQPKFIFLKFESAARGARVSAVTNGGKLNGLVENFMRKFYFEIEQLTGYTYDQMGASDDFLEISQFLGKPIPEEVILSVEDIRVAEAALTEIEASGKLTKVARLQKAISALKTVGKVGLWALKIAGYAATALELLDFYEKRLAEADLIYNNHEGSGNLLYPVAVKPGSSVDPLDETIYFGLREKLRREQGIWVSPNLVLRRYHGLYSQVELGNAYQGRLRQIMQENPGNAELAEQTLKLFTLDFFDAYTGWRGNQPSLALGEHIELITPLVIRPPDPNFFDGMNLAEQPMMLLDSSTGHFVITGTPGMEMTFVGIDAQNKVAYVFTAISTEDGVEILSTGEWQKIR